MARFGRVFKIEASLHHLSAGGREFVSLSEEEGKLLDKVVKAYRCELIKENPPGNNS